MVNITKRRTTRALLIVLTFALGGIGLTACGQSVYSSPDLIKCVYDKKDGRLIKQLMPGENELTNQSNFQTIAVPTSQRFYNIDPRDDVRDPGASHWVEDFDKNSKKVRMNPHARMFLKGDRACEFVTRHLKRNIPQSVLDSSVEDKAGFNVRGDANQPWFVWLRENFDNLLVREGGPLLGQYSWEYYVYKYPLNANTNGELPCKEAIPPGGTCTNTEEPSETARDAIERQLSEKFTQQLNERVGDFFCGEEYDPTDPDNCPPVGVEISEIQLVTDPNNPATDPVKAREELNNQRDATRNAQESARLTEESTAAQVAKKQAEVDQQNALAALEGQYLSNQEVINQAEIIRAEHAKRLAAIEQANATCVYLNASPADCALIIAAEKGQYPQGNGQSVTINPSQQPQSP